MQIFVETLTSKAITLDVLGMIQTIINDAKTIEAEVIDAEDSNASVQEKAKSQVNKVEEEAKAVNTSRKLVACSPGFISESMTNMLFHCLRRPFQVHLCSRFRWPTSRSARAPVNVHDLLDLISFAIKGNKVSMGNSRLGYLPHCRQYYFHRHGLRS